MRVRRRRKDFRFVVSGEAQEVEKAQKHNPHLVLELGEGGRL